MIVPAEQGETANTIRPRRRPIRSGARGDIDLSRELHDHISQTLNLLLLEMEIFKADQVGREGVLRELDRMQTSIRGVLANVRGILHDIRRTPRPRKTCGRRCRVWPRAWRPRVEPWSASPSPRTGPMIFTRPRSWT